MQEDPSPLTTAPQKPEAAGPHHAGSFLRRPVAVLLAILLAVLLAGLGAYYRVGVMVEQRYRELLPAEAAKNNLTLTVTSYNRGIFQSTAQVECSPIAFGRPAAGSDKEQQTMRIVQTHVIHHGPFCRTDKGWSFHPRLAFIESSTTVTFDKGPEESRRLQNELAELFVLRLAAAVNFDNTAEINIDNPAGSRTITQDGKTLTFNWQGMTGQFSLSADRRGAGSLQAPGFELVAGDLRLQISGLQAQVDIHQSPAGLSLGDITYTIDRIQAENPTGPDPLHFSLTGLRVQSTTREEQNKINSTTALGIETINLDNDQHGPLRMDCEIRNLDAAALVRLQAHFAQLQGRQQAIDRAELNQVMLAGLTEFLPAMLKSAPEFEVKQFDIKTRHGDFSWAMQIKVDGDAARAMVSPFQLVGAITAQAEMTISETLLARTLTAINRQQLTKAWQAGELEAGPDEIDQLAARRSRQQLQDLVARHLLVKQDDQIKARATFRQGRLLVNGWPLDVPSANL